MQFKHFCNMLSNCMMLKTRAITRFEAAQNSLTHQRILGFYYLRIYNDCNNVALFSNFYQLSRIDAKLFKTSL